MTLKLKIQLIDPTLPAPITRNGSVGIDLYAREDTYIEPYTMKLVPLNVIVALDEFYEQTVDWSATEVQTFKHTNRTCGTFLLPRSSLFTKHHLILVNSVGVIDASYRGPEDEIKAALYQMGNNLNTSFIAKGERICQLVCLTYNTPEIIIIERDTTLPSRGGFGSTD